MLILLSPAKKLDFATPAPTVETTDLLWPERTADLVDLLKVKTPESLAKLMHLSPALAGLNAERYQRWNLKADAEDWRPALFAFQGDVYLGLDAANLSAQALQFSRRHLRILSGLYGVLRPFDLILAYRLEMGTRLQTPAGKNLYEYWEELPTQQLAQDLEALGAEPKAARVVINLASQEYFRVVQPRRLKAPVITPVFEDESKGKWRVISFYAKQARGRMARYLLEAGADTPEVLHDFAESGYRYAPAESTSGRPVFRRREQDRPG